MERLKYIFHMGFFESGIKSVVILFITLFTGLSDINEILKTISLLCGIILAIHQVWKIRKAWKKNDN